MGKRWTLRWHSLLHIRSAPFQEMPPKRPFGGAPKSTSSVLQNYPTPHGADKTAFFKFAPNRRKYR